MEVSCISDRENLDKKTFVTEHRGYNIYLYTGSYSITLYSSGGYNMGSRGYGDGIYVIASAKDDQTDYIWTSYWVGSYYTQKSVNLGVDKAITKMKTKIDRWVAYSEREDNKHIAAKTREQLAINTVTEKYSKTRQISSVGEHE